MLSATWSSDESAGEEGRGYGDDAGESCTSVRSSILGSVGEGGQPLARNNSPLEVIGLSEETEEEKEVEINIDAAGEWDEVTTAPPPVVPCTKDAGSIKLVACKRNKRAFHKLKSYSTDFFYVYSTLFCDLVVRLPFSEFQTSILSTLNVAPTQLHQNGWVFMQAFTVVCTALALMSTLASSLFFSRALTHPNKSWVSMSPVMDQQLFTLFNTSYKEFKTNFFKVSITDPGRSNFYSDNERPKFAFYWTEHPKRVISGPNLFSAMEKGKTFLLMTARRKEELKKTKEGTSFAVIRSPLPKSIIPSHTVNVALRIALEPQPSSTLPTSAPTPEEVLKNAEDERDKAATVVTKAQNDNRLLQRSNDDLRLGLQRVIVKNKDLIKERDACLSQRDALIANFTEAPTPPMSSMIEEPQRVEVIVEDVDEEANGVKA
ncbi:hypothetical protein LR48_Vigan07g087000 [Vigna angularis]|uniref:Uncharacterized protein n=1 Tax=Phaseolus angularis TaxID=3914 RepID=A0A0L9UWQ5_PHAAN|nr:hypothetical protein LR48_Vigan07g087000 [Vigna angularis]